MPKKSRRKNKKRNLRTRKKKGGNTGEETRIYETFDDMLLLRLKAYLTNK